MTCKEFSGMIPSFLRDHLDDSSLREFLEHYDNCRVCREEVEIQYLVDRAFQQEDASGEINLAKDLPAYIETERSRLRFRNRLWTAASALEVVTVAAVAVTAIVFLR